MYAMRLSLFLALTLSSTALADPRARLFLNGLDKPIYLTAPKQSTDYLYIVEKVGLIKMYDRKKMLLLEEPFLDLRSSIRIKMNEQGLLGMAFSPNFHKDSRFYLYYTDTKGNTQLSRFLAASPTKAVPNSEEFLISQKQDFKNHNGGWIGFGPDGMLYVGLGDGGSANDPKRRSQDLGTLLGKLLRIDVSGSRFYKVPKDNPYVDSDEALSEIYAYGLRNPWRCTWHDNQLFIADVGQNAWEELNVVPLEELKQCNFGWPQLEGTHRTKNPKASKTSDDKTVEPAYEYAHNMKADGGFSITGGIVYQGSVKELQGRYLFADYISNNIWSADYKGGKLIDIQHHKDHFSQNEKVIRNICDFSVDPQGEAYIISHTGSIYKITE